MYLVEFKDGRGNTIHEMPFEQFDNAMAYVRDNPTIQMPKTVKSALLWGVFTENSKRWKSATVSTVSGAGDRTVLHRTEQSRW